MIVHDRLQDVLGRLDGVRSSIGGFTARCAAHDDRHASLSVSQGEDGRVLLHCHAGCRLADVCRAIGLRVADLHPRRSNGRAPRRIVATYDYRSANGELLFQVVRSEPKGFRQRRPDGSSGWIWQLGQTPRVLYRLPELLAASADEWVFVVEGEKDADRLASIGLIATCNPGGAGKWRGLTDDLALRDRRVAIIPDKDSAGHGHAEDVAKHLHGRATELRILELPDAGKDATDWLDSGGTAEQLRQMAEAAPLYSPFADNESGQSRLGCGAGSASLTSTDGLDAVGALATEQAAITKAVLPWIPFPTQRLPEPLQSFVEECASAIGCDPAMVALPSLAIVAAAVGMSRRIRLKRTWAEPAIIWSIVVAESGELKSPALDQVRNVINRHQEHALQQHDKHVVEYEAVSLKYDANLKHWMNKRHDRGEPPEKPEAPVCPRFLVEDVTTEALAPILRANPRGVLLCRDELSGWLGSFDNYHAGRGGDVARWLEMHRGGSLIVDRKTGRERTIHVPRAAVSLTGTVQPQTLRRALSREHIENGLAARMLLTMPPRKPKRWSERELSDATALAFEKVIEHLYSMQLEMDPHGSLMPVDLPLSTDGRAAWVEFYNQFASVQNAVTGDLAKAFAKLEGYAARFALLIHVLRWAANDPTLLDADAVDAESVEAGAALSRWFCNECERVYHLLFESDGVRAHRQLAEWIAGRGGGATARDLTHGLRRFRGNAEAANSALEALIDTGIGAWNETVKGPGAGRPTRRFELATGVTVTETPSGDSENRGFGDGDDGDNRRNRSSVHGADPLDHSETGTPPEADPMLAEDVETALTALGEPPPGCDPSQGDHRGVGTTKRRTEASPDLWYQAAVVLIDVQTDSGQRAELRERFEHRAAVCEYDGGLSRSEAERVAFRELRQIAPQ